MIQSLLKKLARKLNLEIVQGTNDAALQDLLSIYREFRLDHCTPLLQLDRSPQFSALTSLRELIRHYQINYILDVGANRGQFGASIRKLGYRGTLVSFEPQADARNHLLELSKNDPHWTIRSEALGARQTKERLHVFADDTFSSVHPINDDGRRRFGSLVEEVKGLDIDVMPLDLLAEELGASVPGRRILLKTDTQGYDLEVIRGATRLLDSVDVVVTEASFRPIYSDTQDFSKLAGLLRESGFHLSGIFPISHMADTLTLIEADCHFVKAPATNA